MGNNNSTKIRVIGNDFNERDEDGNIKVNVAYINKGNMTAKEAKEQIRKVEEYAKQRNMYMISASYVKAIRIIFPIPL